MCPTAASGPGSDPTTRAETRLGAGSAVAQRESERPAECAGASGEGRRFSFALGCLILAAWGVLAAGGASPYAGLLGGAEGAGARPPHASLALMLAGWIVMAVAMMLPGELPRLHRLRRQLQGQARRPWLVALFVLGYLLAWGLFGLLVGLGQAGLYALGGGGAQAAAPAGPGIFICELSGGASTDLAGAAVLLVAGIYQWTPAKRERLGHCRPLEGQPEARQGEAWSLGAALRRGAQRGGACVGSCWALMLCMVAVGMSLGVMLALGLVMAFERASPWGRSLVRPLGLGLVALAIIVYGAR